MTKITDLSWIPPVIAKVARSRDAMKLIAALCTISMVTVHLIVLRFEGDRLVANFGEVYAHMIRVADLLLTIVGPFSLIVLANTPKPPHYPEDRSS